MNLSQVLPLTMALLSMPLGAFGDEGNAGRTEFFEKRIRPVLVRHCYECHSAASTKLKGGLRVDSREFIRAGGDSGPAVVPGSAAESLLLQAVIQGEMPPEPEKKLPDQVIADFVRWIESGAVDPRDQPPTAEEAAELSWQTVLNERRNWWSLQPVAENDPPEGAEQPIDAFILAKQRAAGIQPTEPADARTLARRLPLVLTGLPPAAAEIEQFMHESKNNPDVAYEALVERLLDSPHFGEHWTRHWLDVVRFAETHGYEWNHEIRDAWRYRDYLIRAFNEDVPYDQLVREHIAGDLLEIPRLNGKLGINESIIGTAFWRFGELGHDNCVDFPEIRFDALDNQIDTFSKAFQGLTVSCARCHDHKLDAISTKDYYALVGMLENCSQVVHTLDSPERIAGAASEIRQLKVALRQQLGETWLAAIEPMSGTILAALAGETTLLTSAPPGRENPAYALKPFAKPKPSDHAALRSAKWIWERPGANQNEPNTVPIYVRFVFDLDELPEKAALHATADDRVVSYVNGHRLGVNESWKTPARYDLAKHLVKGRNTIALEAANGTGPAGLIASAVIDGEAFGSNAQWKVTRKLAKNWTAREFDDTAWASASELGPSSMAPWSLVDPNTATNVDIATRWQKLAEEYGAEHSRREKMFADKFDDWADFRAPSGTNWMQSGLGLSGPNRAGDFAVAYEGEQIVASILPAGLHTNVTSDKLNGSLRSPWLPTEKKFVSLQLRGDRRSMVRIVIDSCGLNEFAGGGLDYLAGAGGRTKWKTFSTSPAPSQRSFIELTTRSDNPRWPDRPGRAGTTDGKELEGYRSSFGVMRAVLHDDPGGPQPDLTPMLALFEQASPSDESGIAAAFQAIARNSITAWKEDRATNGDVHWLNWLLRTGLLPNSVGSDQRLLGELVNRYRNLASALPEPRVVAGLADQGSNRAFPVLQGGDPKKPLGTVPARYLEVISGKAAFESSGSGRRELAELIASPDNPLTARVIVNRVWHHLFGRGIVATPDDFGHMGVAPTHPELLDRLAAEFIEGGWSIKRLIRRIVLSQTFRQSSTPVAANAQFDPGNRLLHHYPARRLDAEAIRDTILAVSGRLERTLFGPGIHPHRAKETDYRKLYIGPLDGDGRRSIYIKVTRMEGPQFLELFDFPNRMVTHGRRDRTNVPAQALAMLNDPFVIDQARFWAEQVVVSKHDSIEERVQGMFQRGVGRPPSEGEQERFVALIRSLADGGSADDAALIKDKSVWQDAAHAIFNMKELIYIR